MLLRWVEFNLSFFSIIFYFFLRSTLWQHQCDIHIGWWPIESCIRFVSSLTSHNSYLLLLPSPSSSCNEHWRGLFFFSSKSYQPFFFPCVHNALRKYTHCSTVGRSVGRLLSFVVRPFFPWKKGAPSSMGGEGDSLSLSYSFSNCSRAWGVHPCGCLSFFSFTSTGFLSLSVSLSASFHFCTKLFFKKSNNNSCNSSSTIQVSDFNAQHGISPLITFIQQHQHFDFGGKKTIYLGHSLTLSLLIFTFWSSFQHILILWMAQLFYYFILSMCPFVSHSLSLSLSWPLCSTDFLLSLKFFVAHSCLKWHFEWERREGEGRSGVDGLLVVVMTIARELPT